MKIKVSYEASSKTSARVGNPSAAIGPLGVGVKNSKSGVSCEGSAKNRTPVGPSSAAFCRPLAPSLAWGWALRIKRVMFRVRRLAKTGPGSDSLRRPSAAIEALWVGVKRRYGFPPSNSPHFLYVYNVDVFSVVRTVLTRRRGSADFEERVLRFVYRRSLF